MEFSWNQSVCLGIAGNIAGHLEQAGEAAAFAATPSEVGKPKGIFATYLPGAPKEHFLSQNPLSHTELWIPKDQNQVQIEPELYLSGELHYDEQGLVQSIAWHGYGAYNDVSIRDPQATKISHKKNWGPNSKAFGPRLDLTEFHESFFEHLSIASLHRRDGEWHWYGHSTPVLNYSCFGQELSHWIVQRLNTQEDQGQLENLRELIALAGRPQHLVIGCGATTYTPWGETQFLKDGDACAVAIMDRRVWTDESLLQCVQSGSNPTEGISLLVREVRVLAS